MKTYLRAFLCGVLFCVGVAGVGLTIGAIQAADISLMTGPAGSNPAASPQNLGDYNSIIRQVNANAAFAGTGTPSGAIGVQSVTTGSIGGSTSVYQMLKIVSAVFTSTTGASTCRSVSAKRCLGLLDNIGDLIWIAVE